MPCSNPSTFNSISFHWLVVALACAFHNISLISPGDDQVHLCLNTEGTFKSKDICEHIRPSSQWMFSPPPPLYTHTHTGLQIKIPLSATWEPCT